MKKIKIFFSAFVVILSVLSLFSVAANKPTVYLEDTIKYDNKDNVTVSIYMKDTNPDIVTLGLDLKYDTSKLEYVNSKAGKDLKATLKLDENILEESRVAIAIISVNGLKNDGLYYQINFKVKDASQDIPLELSLREATDSDGNDIKIETTDGKIVISQEEVKQEEQKKVERIEDFEVTDVDELTSIEDIISEATKVEVGSEDVITYEVEDTSIVEILNDGTIIPNKNGSSKVRVKMNGQDIGTVEILVKDGTVEKIIGKEEVSDFTPVNNLQKEKSEIINKEEYSSSNNLESQNKTSHFYIILIVIIVIFTIVILIFINRKQRRKYE